MSQARTPEAAEPAQRSRGRRPTGRARDEARRGARRYAAPPRPVRLIEPRSRSTSARLGELWRYRRLVRFFSRRYIEKRYVRTWLGWLWLPLRPVLSVASRVLLFGALLAVPSEGKPYLLFYLVGFSAWTLFSETTYWATRSLELNRSLLRRMYVPRLTVLMAAPAPGLVNYALYMAITGLVVAYFAIGGTFHLEFAPDSALLVGGGLALMVAIGLCLGLFLSVYGARARDVRFSLGYVLNLWLFVTPVIYPLSAVPDNLRALVVLNPLTAPVEMIRHGLLGTGEGVPTTSLAVTFGTALVLGVGGLIFFARSEAEALDSL